MASKKINSSSTSTKAANSKFYADVESILDVTFGSFGLVTRSKASSLGQQAPQVSPALTPIFGSSSSKGERSSTNVPEGGSDVAEKIKKTLALLDLSGSKNSVVKEDDDASSDGSSPLTQRSVSHSRINLCDNPCYSPSSTTIMQAMVTNTSSMEEQLANLTEAIAGLTKCIQNQDARIDKLIDRVGILMEEESTHATGKLLEVPEIDSPSIRVASAKAIPVSSEGMIPIDQLKEFIEGTIKNKYEIAAKSSLTYAKLYTARIDMLKMHVGYQPPKFQQFDGKGNPKQHVAHCVKTCNNAGTYGDYLVKQFVRSLKGNAFDWYIDLEAGSIDSWDQLEQEFLNRFYSTKAHCEHGGTHKYSSTKG